MANELKKPARLIAILVYLAERRGKPVTVKEIKAHLDDYNNDEITIRALQRDMTDLSNIPNVPIELKVSGDAKNGYTYSISRPLLKHIIKPFAANEVMAGYIVSKLSPFFKGTKFEQQFNSLLEKVEGVMDDKIFEDLDSIKNKAENNVEFIPFGVADSHYEDGVFENIIKAISKDKTVKIKYNHDKGAFEEIYIPIKVLIIRNTMYLIVRRVSDNKHRTLRLDKILSVKLLRDKFKLNSSDKKEIEKIKSGMGVFHFGNKKPENIILIFNQKVKSQIINKSWHSSQKVKELKNGNLEVKLKVVRNEELISWIFYWQSFVEVIKPVTLRKELKMRAEYLVKQYCKK